MNIMEQVVEQIGKMETDKFVFLGLVLVGLVIVVQQSRETSPPQEQQR